MLITGVVSLCAAVMIAAAGLWTLTRPRSADPRRQAIRALVPTQFAAAVMLGAGGIVALTGGRTGWVVLLVCVLGAVGTLAAGSWQGARFAVAQAEAQPAGCAGSCAACTLSCQ